MLTLPVEPLQRLIQDIFRAEGCSDAEAGRIAKSLIGASLTGHDSHGVLRTPRYVLMLRQGEVEADRAIEIVHETGSFALVDGHFGFGQTIAPQSVELGIRKARQDGVSIIAVRNSGHIGRVGDWAEMAAEAGFISIYFVNVAGSQLVAPHGGVERRMSTAPFTVGFPREGEHPIILDFATSLVAEGKVMIAANGGPAVPAGALISTDGTLSNEPRTLYGDAPDAKDGGLRTGKGAIRAMGDHKGSGLAIICELLAGAFTGSGCSGPESRRFSNGMLSFYIDPKALGLAESMRAEAETFLDWVKTSRRTPTATEILLPGDPERRSLVKRQLQGLPMPELGWSSLCRTARDADIDVRRYDFGVAIPDTTA